MNKKVIWIIVIALIVIIGLFFIFKGEDSDDGSGGGIVITDGPSGNENTNTENAADLQSPDDVFSELDNSLEYVE